MKIRNDFVSNSSSCSFIILDPLKFKEALVKFGGDYMWELKDFEIRAECALSNRDAFKDIIKDDSYGYEYDCKYRFPISIDELFSLSDDKYSLISSIEFQCDDFNTSHVFMLSILKKALENMEVSVTSEYSEHPLLLEDEDNYDGNEFLRNICKVAFGQKYEDKK